MTNAPPALDDRLVQSHEYAAGSFPFDEWRWLRANDPIHWTDATGVENFWAITRHRHITEISSQPERFSSERGNIILLSLIHI